ncbi:probable receptor-like protein kinase At2g42960 [Cucumis melo]|uniref:non-specific serine/threonine protein kinase n=1 Tax=Cucumis melo TaxID=3656 RepID=A0ABM3KKB9_CUCME|nr:probable receptor-like protein kinase At2g42960 [Cucumis melo]
MVLMIVLFKFKLLLYRGQAEKESRVEVEAIGYVRHKKSRTAPWLLHRRSSSMSSLDFFESLLREYDTVSMSSVDFYLSRMLAYEYLNNGNLEQWLHGAMRQYGTLTWEARVKVALPRLLLIPVHNSSDFRIKGLAYLHEAIKPKVVHRDIKSSNILIDDEFNAKVSYIGLANILDAGESHITTRVMGAFWHVAPEYANTGLLNEKINIYSFGVLLLETITGRDLVNLVEWLKVMVGTRRAEEVIDPSLETKPNKRPKMTQVVRMLEAVDYPSHEVSMFNIPYHQLNSLFACLDVLYLDSGSGFTFHLILQL